MDLVRTELEGGHIGVARVDAFGQRLAKGGDRIIPVQRAQRRGDLDGLSETRSIAWQRAQLARAKAFPRCSAVGAASAGVIRKRPIRPWQSAC